MKEELYYITFCCLESQSDFETLVEIRVEWAFLCFFQMYLLYNIVGLSRVHRGPFTAISIPLIGLSVPFSEKSLSILFLAGLIESISWSCNAMKVLLR